MKAEYTFPVGQLHGSIKGQNSPGTFQQRGAYGCLMNRPIPTGEPTVLQAAIRSVRAAIATCWATVLTNDKKESWRVAAEAQYEPSGYALFSRLMWPRAAAGYSINQAYAAYTGALLTFSEPYPNLYYDADLVPPSDPDPAQLYLFTTTGYPLTPLTYPTSASLAFARFTHYPVSGGRTIRDYMLTSARTDALALSFLSIPAFFAPASWSSNLCTNGTFTGNNTTGWTLGEYIYADANILKFDDCGSNTAQWNATTPVVGQTYRIVFDLALSSDAEIGFTFGGHTGIHRTGDPGTFTEEFVATATDKLNFHWFRTGDDTLTAIDNVIIQKYTAAVNLTDTFKIVTDASSLNFRVTGNLQVRIQLFDLATGQETYNDYRELARNPEFHD